MKTPHPVGLVIAFVVLSLGFGWLERRWPALPDQKRRREDWKTDAAYWFFTPFVTETATRLAIVLVFVALAVLAGVPFEKEAIRRYASERETWATSLPMGVQVVLLILAGDFFSYWQHRAFHRPLLWKFHAVHHGSPALDWLAAVRVHPANEILGRLFQLVALFLLGFKLQILAAYAPFLTLYAILLHANVPWDFGPLRYVIATPKFHRWHHTSEAEGLDKNFGGLLSVWDQVFGTFYMPEGRQPEKFGITGEQPPQGLFAQLVWPLR